MLDTMLNDFIPSTAAARKTGEKRKPISFPEANQPLKRQGTLDSIRSLK